MPAPGEPMFTEDDTAAAVALAEEERDTCPSCGMPKVICRDPERPFTDYEIAEETCQVTLRIAHFHEGQAWKDRHESSRKASQVAVRPREGFEPPFDAGLDLGTYNDDPPDDGGDEGQS